MKEDNYGDAEVKHLAKMSGVLQSMKESADDDSLPESWDKETVDYLVEKFDEIGEEYDSLIRVNA